MRAAAVLLLICSAGLSGPRSDRDLALRQAGIPSASRDEGVALQDPVRAFRVRLDTTKGSIVIAVHRDWAPRGADRFRELVTAGYYDDNRFFRVVKGQWAQFGINGDPKVAAQWRTRTIPDDQ